MRTASVWQAFPGDRGGVLSGARRTVLNLEDSPGSVPWNREPFPICEEHSQRTAVAFLQQRTKLRIIAL